MLYKGLNMGLPKYCSLVQAYQTMLAGEPGLIRLLRALQGSQGPYKTIKGLTRPLRAFQGRRGPYKALKGLIS